MNWKALGEITLLITDDDAFNRQLVISLLSKITTIHFFEAEDGVEALEILGKKPIDIILLDLHMPKMDGYETLKIIKKDIKYSLIPTIIITTDEEEMKKLYLLGADDFISKPFDLKELESRIYKHVENKKDQRDQEKAKTEEIPQTKKSVINTSDKTIENSSNKIDRTKTTKQHKNTYSLEEIEVRQKESFYMMAKMFYTRENRFEQSKKVALLAKGLSLLIGYDKKIADNIYYATFIKDIGHIFMKDRYSSLDFNSKEGRDSYKNSIISGYQLLNSSIETEFIQIAKKIMIQHREHYNGTGFPQQLKEKEIHILSCIVSVVEGFDRLLSGEKYLNERLTSTNELYNFFNTQSSQYFHPKITQLFLEHFDYFIQLREKIIKQY